MTMIVRDDGGTPRTITAIQVRDGTNTPRDISEMYVRDSNAVSRLVFSLASPLSLAITPGAVGGLAYGSGTVTTDAATATPTGGVAPYTYAWTVVSHSNATPPAANSPASNISTFTQTAVVETDDAVFRCTVTDDNGATAFADLPAFFQNVVPPYP